MQPLFFNSRPGIYHYCPSVLQEPDGTRYLYYCTNRDSYRIVDFIGCRKGTPDETGGYRWSEETLVFAPSADGWDAHHTCDPSVIAGVFRHAGKEWHYLLAYLGCTSYDNQDNEIGLAVSDSPTGPFVRISDRPFVSFRHDPNNPGFQWGVGQASLLNLDGCSDVLILYTRGDGNGTRVLCERWDLSNLDAPVQMREAFPVSVRGLHNLNGAPDDLNNADFAYDPKSGSIFCLSDSHPCPRDRQPIFIASHVRLNRADAAPEADLCDALAAATWTDVAEPGPRETGFPRNHNGCLVRDSYGRLPDPSHPVILYTVSVTSPGSLWSYRLYEHTL